MTTPAPQHPGAAGVSTPQASLPTQEALSNGQANNRDNEARLGGDTWLLGRFILASLTSLGITTLGVLIVVSNMYRDTGPFIEVLNYSMGLPVSTIMIGRRGTNYLSDAMFGILAVLAGMFPFVIFFDGLLEPDILEFWLLLGLKAAPGVLVGSMLIWLIRVRRRPKTPNPA